MFNQRFFSVCRVKANWAKLFVLMVILSLSEACNFQGRLFVSTAVYGKGKSVGTFNVYNVTGRALRFTSQMYCGTSKAASCTISGSLGLKFRVSDYLGNQVYDGVTATVVTQMTIYHISLPVLETTCLGFRVSSNAFEVQVDIATDSDMQNYVNSPFNPYPAFDTQDAISIFDCPC